MGKKHQQLYRRAAPMASATFEHVQPLPIEPPERTPYVAPVISTAPVQSGEARFASRNCRCSAQNCLDRYGNIFIVSMKKSGKTTVVQKLSKLVSKATEVHVFCPTVDRDDKYLEMKKWYEDNDIKHSFHKDIKDTSDLMSRRPRNILQEIMVGIVNGDNETGDDSGAIRHVCSDNPCSHITRRDARLPLEATPFTYDTRFVTSAKFELFPDESSESDDEDDFKDYLFIYDDLGQGTRSPIVSQIAKTSRHHLMRVITSSQWVTDLEPAAIRQQDYIIVFKGFPHKKLQELHTNLTLAVDLPTFLSIYDRATDEKYQFLVIDVYNNVFIKSFESILYEA